MKKLLSVIMCVAMLVTSLCVFTLPASAGTNGITQSQAVEWIKARGNEAWWQDVDGAYGCQCVDLVKAYYNYLGVGGYATGNGGAYTSNALPDGWTRDHNATPGSIFSFAGYVDNGVWVDTYGAGHVGLVYAVEGNTKYTVETNLPAPYDGGANAYAQFKSRNFNSNVWYIHPDFAGGSSEHTHDWVYQWFWKDHPHYDEYKCSICGEVMVDYNSEKYYDLCDTCNPPQQDPVGALELAEMTEDGNVHVKGWAYDPDNYLANLDIVITVGEGNCSTDIDGEKIVADEYRLDIDSAYGCGYYHGFDVIIETTWYGEQPICAYAIKADITAKLNNDYTLDLPIKYPESQSSYTLQGENVIIPSTADCFQVPITCDAKAKSFVLDIVYDSDYIVYKKTLDSNMYDITEIEKSAGKVRLLFSVKEEERIVYKEEQRLNPFFWKSRLMIVEFVSIGIVGKSTVTITSPNDERNENYDGSSFEMKSVNFSVKVVEPKVTGVNGFVLAFDDIETEAKDQTVMVPLYVVSNDTTVICFDFTVNYDPTVLEFVDVQKGSALCDFSFSEVGKDNRQPGAVRLLCEKRDSLNTYFDKSVGTIFLLTFKVIGDYGDESVISGSVMDSGNNFNYDWNDIEVTILDGSVKLSKEASVNTSVTEPTATEIVEPADILYGDANGDNEINMKDVLTIRKYVADISVVIDLAAADTNGDGAVNMKDVLTVRKYVAGLIEEITGGGETPVTPTSDPTVVPDSDLVPTWLLSKEIVHDADGSSYVRHECDYDENGNLTNEKWYDSDGEFSSRSGHEYDENGNEISRREYDEDGNVIWNLSSDGFYDENNNLLHAQDYATDGSIYGAEDMSYDEKGNLVYQHNTGYGNDDWEQYWEYVYNAQGKITSKRARFADGSVDWSSSETWDSTYDQNGNEISKRYYNEDGSINWWDSWDSVYDTNNNLSKTYSYDDDGRVTSIYEYTYDSNGNQLSYTIYNGDHEYEWRHESDYDENSNWIGGRTFDSDGNQNWYNTWIAAFDENNNQISEYWYEEEGVINWEDAWDATYDQHGNQLTRTYYDYDHNVRYWYEYEYVCRMVDPERTSNSLNRGSK